MKKITAIIPTLNEEIHIEEAINSVSFADEIIVIDSFSSDQTVELAQKHNVQPAQITKWKQEFLNNAESAFEKEKVDKRSESEKERDRLLKSIGELKIENDFLKSALR